MASEVFPIKVPSVKYRIAKDYQKKFWDQNKVMLPLWRCLIDTETQQLQSPGYKDPFKHMRRGFKL